MPIIKKLIRSYDPQGHEIILILLGSCNIYEYPSVGLPRLIASNIRDTIRAPIGLDYYQKDVYAITTDGNLISIPSMQPVLEGTFSRIIGCVVTFMALKSDNKTVMYHFYNRTNVLTWHSHTFTNNVVKMAVGLDTHLILLANNEVWEAQLTHTGSQLIKIDLPDERVIDIYTYELWTILTDKQIHVCTRRYPTPVVKYFVLPCEYKDILTLDWKTENSRCICIFTSQHIWEMHLSDDSITASEMPNVRGEITKLACREGKIKVLCTKDGRLFRCEYQGEHCNLILVGNVCDAYWYPFYQNAIMAPGFEEHNPVRAALTSVATLVWCYDYWWQLGVDDVSDILSYACENDGPFISYLRQPFIEVNQEREALTMAGAFLTSSDPIKLKSGVGDQSEVLCYDPNFWRADSFFAYLQKQPKVMPADMNWGKGNYLFSLREDDDLWPKILECLKVLHQFRTHVPPPKLVSHLASLQTPIIPQMTGEDLLGLASSVMSGFQILSLQSPEGSLDGEMPAAEVAATFSQLQHGQTAHGAIHIPGHYLDFHALMYNGHIHLTIIDSMNQAQAYIHASQALQLLYPDHDHQQPANLILHTIGTGLQTEIVNGCGILALATDHFIQTQEAQICPTPEWLLATLSDPAVLSTIAANAGTLLTQSLLQHQPTPHSAAAPPSIGEYLLTTPIAVSAPTVSPSSAPSIGHTLPGGLGFFLDTHS